MKWRLGTVMYFGGVLTLSLAAWERLGWWVALVVLLVSVGALWTFTEMPTKSERKS